MKPWIHTAQPQRLRHGWAGRKMCLPGHGQKIRGPQVPMNGLGACDAAQKLSSISIILREGRGLAGAVKESRRITSQRSFNHRVLRSKCICWKHGTDRTHAQPRSLVRVEFEPLQGFCQSWSCCQLAEDLSRTCIPLQRQCRGNQQGQPLMHVAPPWLRQEDNGWQTINRRRCIDTWAATRGCRSMVAGGCGGYTGPPKPMKRVPPAKSPVWEVSDLRQTPALCIYPDEVQ